MLTKVESVEDKVQTNQWFYGGLFVFAFAVCFGSVLAQLAAGWWEVKAYSHGFLVIPISLFLVWKNKRALQCLPICPDYICGLLTIFLAGGILVLGRLGALNLLEDISLMIMVPGLVLFLLGKAYLSALAFPLCYLVFMLPFFDLIGDGIYWPFQLFSAKLGTVLLQWFGYAAFLSGQYIELPKVTLDVAQECAGIQYLISILAIGMPLAYLSLRGWHRRVVLVGTAVLIAILANGLRVMLAGVMSYSGDLTRTHGPFHIFQGMFVAWIGFIVLFIGSWWLSRGSEGPCFISSDPQAHIPLLEKQKPLQYRYLAAIGIFLFIGAVLHLYKPKAVPINEAMLSSLKKVGDWEGTGDDLNLYPFRIPGADREIGMVYPDAGGGPLQLYIGYFSIQKQGKELVGHPSNTLYENTVEIPVGGIRVNKTIVNDRQTNHLLLFWYDFNGRALANRYYAKGWGIWNAFRLRENNGAMIVVSSRLDHPDKETLLLKKEIRLVETLLPLLNERKMLNNTLPTAVLP